MLYVGLMSCADFIWLEVCFVTSTAHYPWCFAVRHPGSGSIISSLYLPNCTCNWRVWWRLTCNFNVALYVLSDILYHCVLNNSHALLCKLRFYKSQQYIMKQAFTAASWYLKWFKLVLSPAGAQLKFSSHMIMIPSYLCVPCNDVTQLYSCQTFCYSVSPAGSSVSIQCSVPASSVQQRAGESRASEMDEQVVAWIRMDYHGHMSHPLISWREQSWVFTHIQASSRCWLTHCAYQPTDIYLYRIYWIFIS